MVFTLFLTSPTLLKVMEIIMTTKKSRSKCVCNNNVDKNLQKSKLNVVLMLGIKA